MKQRYMAFLAAGIAAAFLLPACGSRARQARADAEAISAAFEASLARLLENTRTNAELIGEAYAREGSLSLDTSGMGARSGRGGGYGGGLDLHREPGLLGPQGADAPAAEDGGDDEAFEDDAPEPDIDPSSNGLTYRLGINGAFYASPPECDIGSVDILTLSEAGKRELRLMETMLSSFRPGSAFFDWAPFEAILTAAGNLAIFPCGYEFPGYFSSYGPGVVYFVLAAEGLEGGQGARALDGTISAFGRLMAVLAAGADREGRPQALALCLIDLKLAARAAIAGKPGRLLVLGEGGLALAASKAFLEAFPGLILYENGRIPEGAPPESEEWRDLSMERSPFEALSGMASQAMAGQVSFKVNQARKTYDVLTRALPLGLILVLVQP